MGDVKVISQLTTINPLLVKQLIPVPNYKLHSKIVSLNYQELAKVRFGIYVEIMLFQKTQE